MQDADQGEETAGGVEIGIDLALQAFAQQFRSLVVDAAPRHVDGLDLRRRRALDGLVVAVADLEIVLHDPAEGRERQDDLAERRCLFVADVEDQAVLLDGEHELERPLVVGGAHRGEDVLLDQVEDRDLALMLDIRRPAHHAALVELHVDEAVAVGWAAFAHAAPSRIDTDSAWPCRPSASASATAAGPISCSEVASHCTSVVRFMKSSRLRPEAKRAAPAVGSTW